MKRAVDPGELADLLPVSRVKVGSFGRRAEPESAETRTEEKLPRTFYEMRPEPNVAKAWMSLDGTIDLRLSSLSTHQDGLAYNPDTQSVVVCDGMGGIGAAGEVKDNFAFALAHAVAELDDISALASPDVVSAVVERAKSILQDDMGVTVEAQSSRIKSGATADMEWGSTIAAVQRIADTNRWRVATIGDSSVAILDSNGRIKEGFGEAFQFLKAGKISKDGSAAEEALGSKVGIDKETLGGYVRYEHQGKHAEFTEIELADDEHLVVVSDAYLQKTPPSTLEIDAAKTRDRWVADKPRYGDDTTMAIVKNNTPDLPPSPTY
jgi:hypothetical protein